MFFRVLIVAMAILSAAVQADTLPGCWTLSNGVPMHVLESGGVERGNAKGQWLAIDATHWESTWPAIIEEFELSADGQSYRPLINEKDSYDATRAGEGTGFVGQWRRSDGAVVSYSEGGDAEGEILTGHWQSLGEGRIRVTWPMQEQVSLVDGYLALTSDFSEFAAERGCQ